MADGIITFDTSLDNAQLEKGLQQARREIENLKRQIERKSAARSFVEQRMDESQQSIERTKQAIVELEAELASLDKANIDPNDTEAWFSADAKAAQVTQRIEEANEELAQQERHQASLERRWDTLDRNVGEYNVQLETANSRAEALGQSYHAAQDAASGMGVALSSGMAEAETRMEAVQRKIGQMVRRVFLLSVATMGLRALRSMFADALMGNAQLEAAVNGLKATFSGLVNYVAGVVTPVLVGMANTAAAAIRALASVVDSIFGTNITASIAAAQRAVSATNAATKATKQQTKATKQLAKEQRSLMSFDELHRLDDNSDSGGSSPGGTGVPGAGTPGSGGFDVGKISDTLAEIMLILGAAIMAVGAVLAFSGINIPLGITLMAIGALMIYTAYRERWDELPQKVRDAITTALVLTGITLLVIGAVLAFSGINIPLGIGLIAAGAALLSAAVLLNWNALGPDIRVAVAIVAAIVSTAALVIGAILTFSGANLPLGIALIVVGAMGLAAALALNWELMPAKVRQVIGTILAIVGAALLVIGIILCASGVKLPLGIALLAIGAATLAASAALNWAALPNEIRGVITTIMVIVGVAFVVLGSVIAFSGVNLPLGIALIALGAASLVAAAMLNWDLLPQNVRNVVSIIGLIVGGALLVLGIILCATGVALPIGIACLAAGGALLVTSAAINWGYISQKIKEVWNGIVQWWNSGPARVFTVEFWQQRFQVIVTALRSAAETIMSIVGSIANSLSGGLLGGIFGGFGRSVSIPKVSIPKKSVPHLAQGTVIPPNREFMAVLGDQRRGNNIETPEGLMRQVVREEAGAMMAQLILQMAAQQDQGGGDAVMTLNVDGETLAVAVENGRAKAMRRGLISPELSVV